jgi:uncharacterized protein (DUF433 family)
MRPTLTIDPGLQFGAVCLTNTRVPADAVAGCVFAGDSVDSTAENYGTDRNSVLLACWYEIERSRRIPKSYRTSRERDMVKRFGNWATQVFASLAEYDGHPDPWDLKES